MKTRISGYVQVFFFITLFCVAVASSQNARGMTVTVANTNDSGAGSLRQVLADANDGDTINFDSSLNGQTITLTSGELLVSKNVTILGPGANILAVNGNGSGRVFHISGGETVTISGLTITNGFVTGSGVTSTEGSGGGILNQYGTLTVSNCTVSGNSASAGGGISNWAVEGSATLTVSNSTVNDNSASGGGGIYNDGFNAAGGGSGATLTVSNCTVSGNSAGDGGGIYNYGFSGSATLTLSDSTLSGNSAGSGIFNYGQAGIATVTLKDTILNAAASTANIVSQFATPTSLGYNLSSDDGGGFLTGPGDQINTDPVLGALQNNGGPTFTHALLPGSPAIDAGDPNFTPPPNYDQRGAGFPRVVNSRVDIGSFEVQCAPPPSGLIHWWPGDNTATDIQGNNNGSLENGATFAAGEVGQAFSFDSVNAFMQAPASNLPVGNSDRTMEMWVKVNSFVAGEAFFAGYGAFGSGGETYQMGSSGSTLFFSNWGQAIFGPQLQPGVWYHIAATNSGNFVTLYVNGSPVNSGTLTIDTAANTQLYVGRLDDGRRLDGLVDELTIYDRALSATEIQAIYNASSAGKCKTVRLYVSNYGNSTIEKFDSAGADLGVFANSGLNGPHGLAFDTSGNLYAANYGDSTIEKFDSGGNGTLFANSGLSHPGGLAFDSSGNLYAANIFSNTIEKFDSSGNPSLFANSGLSNPDGLAFDSSGNLYAANIADNTIEKFDSAGTATLFAHLTSPEGLAFDSSGNLYAADTADSTIEKFDSSGTPTLFANSGVSSPAGLAFDSSGNLYAANFGDNTIEKFDSAGTPTLFANSGVNSPRFIAVQLISPTAASIQFSSPSYSVNETDGSVTVTVTRNGDTSGSSTVHYATSDSTAISPDDYTGTSGDLTFDPNDTSKTIQISLNDVTDPCGEKNEPPSKSFTVTLSNAGGAILSGPATATVTINDNDAGSEPQFTISASASPSAGGSASGAGSYACGSNVNLMATANSCYTFTNWTEGGNVVSTSPSYSFTANSNRTLVANFSLISYTITANAGTGGTAGGSGSYGCGSQVTVTATADAGFIFTNWTENGSVVSTSASYMFTAGANRTLTANFAPIVNVAVNTNPSGPTFTVDGVTYGTSHLFSWASGSSHTIGTTSPQNGGTGVQYVWSRWSDGGTISHTVTPTKNMSYTASFTKQYFLTMVAGTGGTVTPTSGWKNSGSTVSITAKPTSTGLVSYSFSGWTGTGTGSFTGTNNPASITMNGPITETAAFTQNPVQVTVQTSPVGRSFSVDGTTYTAAQTFSWPPGSSHTIATTSTQNGATGVRYVWSRWSDSGTISHTVAPTTNKTYTATFNTQYFLTMMAGNGGTVTPASGWKNSGSTVSITAKPSTGYSFTSWSGTGTGSFSGTTNPVNITIGGPISETAAFTHN